MDFGRKSWFLVVFAISCIQFSAASCAQSDPPKATESGTARLPAAIATQLLIASDETGVSRALTQAAIEAIANDPAAADRGALFRDIRTVAQEARDAKNPAEMLAVLNSPAGRRFALTSRVTPWNPSILRFAGSTLDDPGVPGVSDDRALDAMRNALMSGSGPIKQEDLKSLLGAISPDADASAAQVIAAALPPENRESAEALIGSIANGQLDPAAVEKLSQSVVGLATSQLKQRLTELNAEPEERRLFGAPDYASLMRGENAARSLVASAQLVEIVARQLGNRELGNQLARAQTQVKSAMQIYQGVKLLASASSGGAVLAAFSILSASDGFGPDTGNAQTAELLNAIADLTALVTKEFSRVNSKLDAVQSSLDEIGLELKQIKHVQRETLNRVSVLQSDVDSLLLALPDFEQSLKFLVVATEETSCAAYRTGQLQTPPTGDLFYKCLNLYRLMAKERLTLAQLPSGADDDAALISAFPPFDQSTMHERWAKAPLVAFGAAKYLGMNSMLRFAEGQTASRLRSGAFVTRGLESYLDWMQRFGGNLYAAGSLKPDPALGPLLLDARLQDDFRQSLLPPKGARKKALVDFARSFGKSADDREDRAAAERIRAATLQAITSNVIKAHIAEIKHLGIPLPVSIPIGACQDSSVNTFFSYSAAELIAQGVPEDLTRYAISLGPASYSIPQTGIDVPLAGLYACISNLSTSESGSYNGNAIMRRTVADVEVWLGGSQLCSPQHQESSSGKILGTLVSVAKSKEVMEHDAVLENIRKCFEGIGDKDSWMTTLAEDYLEDGESGYLAAAIASAVDDQAITAGDVEKVVSGTEARLAFLRGYLLFAYPSTRALPPPFLQENLYSSRWSHSASEILAGYKCFGDLERARRSLKQPLKVELDDPAGACARTPIVVGVRDLLNYQHYSETIGRVLAMSLSPTDWDSLEEGEISETSWVGDRLQHFLDSGNTAEYWRSLPKPSF